MIIVVVVLISKPLTKDTEVLENVLENGRNHIRQQISTVYVQRLIIIINEYS